MTYPCPRSLDESCAALRIKFIRGASPGIPYELWDKNTIGWRRWNIATQERKVCKIALKYTKMTKSKTTSKTRQILAFRMEPKITTLLPICFKITAMHWVCCCSLPISRRSPLEKGPLIYLFLPRPGSTPGLCLPKSLNTGAGPRVLHPYKVS